MSTMKEMESAVPKSAGNIVAVCAAGKVGLILRKAKVRGKTTWLGRVLHADKYDCEYRIIQVKNARLLATPWRSVKPEPIGFLPPDEVKTLLAGGSVTRGCD